MKIGILGGSFNPIHNSHIALCEVARQHCSLDRLILIPTGDNPFKETENLVSRFDRLNMTRLAVIGLPGYEVSDIEVSREGVSYTIDTVGAIRETLDAADEIYFIIGSDLIKGLEKWKSFASLCKLVKFICVMRYGINDEDTIAEVERLKTSYGAEIIVIENEDVGKISSTFVRALARTKDEALKGYVNERVYRYITGRELYDRNSR